MESQDRNIYQRNGNDGPLNYQQQKENNQHPQKFNKNISKSNNNLEVPHQNFISKSNNNINDYRRRDNNMNNRRDIDENQRRNHNRSKSNVDIRHQQQRRKGGSTDDYNSNNNLSRSRSNGHAINNYGNRRPDRMGSERGRGRPRNEERDRNRERDRDRNVERDRERNIERDRERDRERNVERDRERNMERDRERDRERNVDRDRERNMERNVDRDRERNMERNVDRDRERNMERDRERDRERNIERDRNRDRGRDRSRNEDRNRENLNRSKSRDRSRPRDNYHNKPHNLGPNNNVSDIKNDNNNPMNNESHLHNLPVSSSNSYKQKYQVNTSSPLSKPTERDHLPSKQPPAHQYPQQSGSIQSLKSRTDASNNSSITTLNQCPMPLKNRLIKNDSSTSVFSEVSITSTNNHYRFTGNINNNYDGGNGHGENELNNNKLSVQNNELEVFDDNASHYYSSDEENNCNGNGNGYNQQNNIPLVERIDPPQVTQPEKPDDIERDRYGFKISYQYISRESQLLFKKNYQPILERRKSRWNTLIKENGGSLPQKISKKVKRFIHKGIPQDLRPMCWFKYSGAEEMQQTYPSLYGYLINMEIQDKKQGKFSTPSKMAKSIEEIEKDLYRTFPDNEKFISDPPSQDELKNHKNDPNAIREIKNPYIRSLRNILVAFSYYSIDPSQGGAPSERHSKYTIGYCQSLNYIAGLLLLIFSDSKELKFPEQSFQVEEKCFWMMIALVDEILPIELYEETQMHGAQIEQDVLWDNLVGENGKKYGLSAVAEWVAYMERGENIHNKSKYANWNTGGTMPALKSITLPWMLTCFVGILPIETVLRVWDCLFTEGSKILIRVILTLFRIFKDDITNISDGMVAWTFIKNMPHRIINCHEFMEICFRPIIYISNPVSMHSSDIDESEELNQSNMDCIDELDNPNHIKSCTSESQFDGDSKSKKDSYRMNFKKRGVGNISQKSIDKFRKQQWDKEQNKK